MQIVNNRFENNVASQKENDSVHLAQGGAVYIVSLEVNKFVLSNNLFKGNVASYGGALHLIANEQATLLNGQTSLTVNTNTFEENIAWWGGGAAVLGT